MNKAERSIHIMIPYGYPIPRETILVHALRGLGLGGLGAEEYGMDLKLTPYSKTENKGYYQTFYEHEGKIFTRELKANSFDHAQSMVEYPHEIVTGKILAKFNEHDDFETHFDTSY